MGGSEKIYIYGFVFWKNYITNSIYISLSLCYIFVTDSGLKSSDFWTETLNL